MPLDARLRERLHVALSAVDEHGTLGPRLLEDAARLWRRIQRFIAMDLVAAEGLDLEALELACYALQLPHRRPRTGAAGRPTRSTLRDRAEESAEQLVETSTAGADADEPLESVLDRSTRVLHEMPHRSPMLDEAKLLADAVNLDDFGVIGLTLQTIQLARQGEGLTQLADGCEKREQYGYWDARLKDGFHFEPVRQIARRRLDHARHMCSLLSMELREDGSP